MGDGRPTISVVTPSYQQGRFIEGTMRSVLGQSYPPIEYLVMDGGSTDGTVEVLRQYGELYGERVWWVSERDDGQPGAVDRAIRRARGEVIGWVNSDDRYADEGVLARVAAAFAEGPEVDIVYGDGLLVDEAGVPFRASRARALRDMKELVTNPTSFVLQPTVFFRRELYLAVGGINTALHWAFDYDLWLRMFPRARGVRYLPEVLAHATAHPGAKSVAGMLKLIRETVEVKRRYVSQFTLTAGDRVRMEVGVASLYAYWVAVRLGLRRAA